LHADKRQHHDEEKQQAKTQPQPVRDIQIQKTHSNLKMDVRGHTHALVRMEDDKRFGLGAGGNSGGVFAAIAAVHQD
jgi:hypothetical protein